MITDKYAIAEKEKKLVFAKDIVTKNQVFTVLQIDDFFKMFNLFCDIRRQCDVQDFATTAKTLGYDEHFPLVYDAISGMAYDLNGEWINFQTFLTMLTERIGHTSTQEGRKQVFDLVDLEGKSRLTFSDLRRISEAMKYNLSDDEIQQVITRVSGKGKRDVTWETFNNYIAIKMQKKNSFL